MKKLLFILLFVSTLFWFANANCVEFWDSEICIDVKNKWNWNYELERTYNTNDSDWVVILSCEILTPDGRMRSVWTCDWSFNYSWNWYEAVRYYISYFDERKTLNTNVNFFYLTSSQYSELKSVYTMWSSLVSTLESRYSSLYRSSEWITKSDDVYNTMSNILNWKESNINNYSQFQDMVVDFVQLTISLR